MAQPPDFVNDTHKRMMRTRDKRITELQKECDKLKGDIEEYHAKMRKLQWQLMNGDVHQGWNTLQTSEFDSYDHSNQDIIARFCKNKLFLIINSYILNGRIIAPVIRIAFATNATKRLTYQSQRMVSFFGLIRWCQ
jgi:hypothetical protein